MNYLTRTTCFRKVHGLIIVPFYDILTVQTCECVAQFCEWIPIYWGNLPSVYRGGSRGRAPEVRTPPGMTCGFLIQLVFCKKKKKIRYAVILAWFLSMFYRLVLANFLFSLRNINLTLGLLPPRRHVEPVSLFYTRFYVRRQNVLQWMKLSPQRCQCHNYH